MAAEELIISSVRDASGCEAGAWSRLRGADGEGDLSHVSEDQMVQVEDEGQAAARKVLVSRSSLNSPTESFV